MTLTLPEGRNLLRVWGDEETGHGEEHFFRVNVVPYWELNGVRLSKDDDCQSTTVRTAAQITDSDCILTTFEDAEFRLYNVINEHFNVSVDVNGDNVISAPDDAALAEPFTLDLVDGENVLRVRLASKGGNVGEIYGSNAFYYKVTGTPFLVSNLGQTSQASPVALSTISHLATQFTTGSNPGGYTVDKVRLPIAIENTGVTPLVSIYSDVSGDPGTRIKRLTNPTIAVSTTETTEAEFDADDFKLDPDTDYWLVVEKPAGSDEIRVEATSGNSEDAGGAPGWSIIDQGKLSTDRTAFSNVVGGLSMQFAVKGALVSSDATLSGLALTDASNNAITLDPAFESAVEFYAATVTNAVSRIRVEPTRNDDTATIKYLDSNDMELSDADATTTGVFDVDLAEGENVIKVKVTAEDTTTTKTYTVRVRRAAADDLVSNLGQPKHVNADNVPIALAFTTVSLDTQFTTGSNANGYTVSKIRIPLGVDAATTTVSVSIFSDNSGDPGSSLKSFTSPGTISTTTQTEVEFETDDYRLSADTSYWIVIARSSGSGTVFVDATTSDAEDAGAAAGWGIGNVSRAGATGLADSVVAQFAIKGALSTADTTPPELVSATVAGLGNSIDLLLNEVYDLPTTEVAGQTYLTTLLTYFTITADGVNVPLSFLTALQRPSTKIITWDFASSKVRQGQTVVVTYTDPTGGDDTVALQDAGGNDMASFTTGVDGVPAVVNGSTRGATPQSAVVPATGLSLEITFDKDVDQTNLPPASALSVTANGSAVTVSAVSAGSSNDKLSLTIAAPGIGAGFDVKVSYSDPTTGDDANAIQDIDGYDAVSFTDFAVTNNSALDLTPPTLVSATVAGPGNSIALLLNEVYDLPTTEAAANTYLTTLLTYFTITADGVNVPLSFLTSQNPLTKIITWEFSSTTVRQGQTVVVTYTDPTGGDDMVALQDAGGNDTASFTTGADSVPAGVNGSTVAKSAPESPTSLDATAGGAGEINLTWVAPTDNGGEPITGYKIEVSDDAVTTWTDLVADTGDQITTYTHSGLGDTTTRHYRVSAINTLGTSSPSNVDSATTAAQGNTTLTALVLKDTGANAITLDPTFAYDVESYTATVAHAVDQITVEPTKFDNTSTIKYLDSNDMELSDADATTTGVFDVDLAEGENVIKVEVTSSDAMTKTTYTVRVRRTAADDLVSNLGQSKYRSVSDNVPIVVLVNTGS